jgi:hypothetical protein
MVVAEWRDGESLRLWVQREIKTADMAAIDPAR